MRISLKPQNGLGDILILGKSFYLGTIIYYNKDYQEMCFQAAE